MGSGMNIQVPSRYRDWDQSCYLHKYGDGYMYFFQTRVQGRELQYTTQQLYPLSSLDDMKTFQHLIYQGRVLHTSRRNKKLQNVNNSSFCFMQFACFNYLDLFPSNKYHKKPIPQSSAEKWGPLKVLNFFSYSLTKFIMLRSSTSIQESNNQQAMHSVLYKKDVYPPLPSHPRKEDQRNATVQHSSLIKS